MTSVSSLSLQLLLNNSLSNEQNTLAGLNEELASNQKYDNLTQYSPTEASQMLNFENAITQRQSYVSSINTVQSRLSVYDTTMTDIEGVASTMQNLAQQNQNYDPDTVSNVASQANAYLQQVASDLNQKVGDRYIYAGSRYATAPVVDPTTLTDTPSATPTSGTVLPDYDTDYVAGSTTSNANAYNKDAVTVDSGYSVSYGVTSTDPAFQQVISGLRFMSAAAAAGKSGDTATYQSDMEQASNLLSSGLSAVQSLHAGVSSAQNTLTTEAATQNTNITNLQDQIGDIQSVNLTTVGTEINLLQSQLQASYSATASFEQLSLVKYL